MKLKLVTLLSVALICLCLSTVAATSMRTHRATGAHRAVDARYKIYCVDGRVDIDTMTPEEIKNERKVEVCPLTKAEFENLSDAREAAKRFGGVGAPCECKAGS